MGQDGTQGQQQILCDGSDEKLLVKPDGVEVGPMTEVDALHESLDKIRSSESAPANIRLEFKIAGEQTGFFESILSSTDESYPETRLRGEVKAIRDRIIVDELQTVEETLEIDTSDGNWEIRVNDEWIRPKFEFTRVDTTTYDGDEIGYEYNGNRLEKISSQTEPEKQYSDGDIQPESSPKKSVSQEPHSPKPAERAKINIPRNIPAVTDVSVTYGDLADTSQIGGGGSANVLKATLSTPDEDVPLAIKQPRTNETLHQASAERLLTEAETWDKLDDHPHIVAVVDYDSKPIPWIAMEYMDGGHLGERSGEVSMSQTLWTALTVTKGIRHAHRKGVAHLDLKPENILFRAVEDAWDVPKVADWGLSKHLLDHSTTHEGLSVEYAAPEQFDDEYGDVDNITDIYQLGAVLYELFTGQLPFERQSIEVIGQTKDTQPTPPSNIADVPAELDEILLTALAPKKNDRYDDIVYFRDSLQELFDEWTSNSH